MILGTETDCNSNPTLKYHRLGTSQNEDLSIYSDTDPNAHPSIGVSDCGNYIFLTIRLSCDPGSRVGYMKCQDLENANREFKFIVNDYQDSFDYVTNEDSTCFFVTDKNAPLKRIVKFDLNQPQKGFEEVIAETKDVIDKTIVVDHDKIVIARLEDVKHVVTCYNFKTGERLYNLPLPVGSMIHEFSAKKKDSVLFYKALSYISPGIIYKFDFKTQTQCLFYETAVKGLLSDELETKQVFYSSKDGTIIPMFLTYKKGLKTDGNNPTLLYGYGGFNISMTPNFSAAWVNFIQNMGGIVAVANIRGGAEYGMNWYNAGRLKNKQNVFDDFQAAARYLQKEKYTSPAKTAIYGGSNGGLLVGTCINQTPELFACGIAAVGVLDMLKFHKFTIGHAWVRFEDLV